MNDWTTDNAANRIKKSYFNGFIDMSGGELTVRHRGATFGGDVSFGTGVDISGDISTRGAVDIGSTLTVTEDLSAHALVAVQQLTVAGDASFAGVRVDGNLNVGGSITSGGGTLELEGLTLTGDLSAHALISTANLDVVSDASFQNNVYVNGDLDVDGSLNGTDASFGGSLIVHGAGMFTGSTNINSTTSPAGVYLGNNGTGNQDSIIQMTSTGDHSVIDFTSSAATGDNQDFEGRIVYSNSTNSSNPYRLHLIPKRADNKGLRLDPASSGNVVLATVEGHLKVDNHADIDGTLTVDGASTMNNTLAIVEAGAGTAASATGGSITLSHTETNGTGKNSIVFRSASDSGSDFGYIQYHDDGAGGSGSENGLLTIGVQNDAIDWGQGITHEDQIKFDIAGASAYLQGRANSTGGNLASLLSVGSGYFTGIYSDAFDISDAWNQGALDDYSSTSLQDRFAMYQYFDNADDHRQDMALVGFNGATGDAVDGSKPYGYMYRCSRTPNRFIAFQTIGLEGSNDSRGMKLGVSAYPGTNYEFAVGGKSHLGNDVDISGDLTVEGAGIFTGVSTGYNSTTSPSGIYIGNYVSGSDEYANMQIVSNNSEKKSVIDFTNTGVGASYADFEGRIAYHGEGGTGDAKAILFWPHGQSGGYMKVESLGSSAAEAVVDGMLTLSGGVPAHVRDYESASFWNAQLLCGNDYRISWSDARSAAYLYVNNGYDDNADLLLTGHHSGGGGKTSTGYNLYSKGAVQAGVTDQGLCIQTKWNSTQCFRIGLGGRPGTYQFLTTGDVQVGGNLDICGNLTIAGTNTYTSLQASTLGSTGDLTIDPTGKVHITKSLQVDGSINFNGDFIKTNTIVRMTEQVDISNDGTGPALKVTQHGNHDVAEFYDDDDLVMIVKNGGDVSFAQSVTVGGDLTVNGTLTANSQSIVNTYTAAQINDNSFSIYSNANGTIQYRADYSDASAGIYMRIGHNGVGNQELIPSMNFVKDGLGDEPIKIAYYARGAESKEICNLNTYWNNDTSMASFTIDLYNDTDDTIDQVVEFTNTNGARSAKFSSNLIFTENQNDIAPMLTNDLSGLLLITYTPPDGSALQGPQITAGETYLLAHTTKPRNAGVHMGVFRYQRRNPNTWDPYKQESIAEIDLNSTGLGYYGNFITFWMNRYGSATDGKYVARMYTKVDESANARFVLETYNHIWARFDVDYNNNRSITFGSDVYAPDFIQSSDLRLKTDIETIENALDKVCRLRGVSYRLKENYDPESTKSLGMIAQEMEQEFPELVSEFKKDTDGDGEEESYKAISYGGFTAPLLEAVKELKARNDVLEAKTPELETKLGSLETTVAAMNARIKALETA